MKRIYLWIKKTLGFRMMYGELAEIAGKGPCLRCVGQAVSGPLSEDRPSAIQVGEKP